MLNIITTTEFHRRWETLRDNGLRLGMRLDPSLMVVADGRPSARARSPQLLQGSVVFPQAPRTNSGTTNEFRATKLLF